MMQQCHFNIHSVMKNYKIDLLQGILIVLPRILLLISQVL
jgi:hypothetical protein